MASVAIQRFGGLVPRVSPRLLGNGDATLAENLKLWSGELRPLKTLGRVRNVTLPTSGAVETLYLLIDKWLAWTVDVDVVTGFTTLAGAGRIYYTGDGAPKQTTYDLVKFGPATPQPASTYPIGLVGPTAAPVIGTTADGPGDPETYSYVYTFYNLNNEESVPSPPSQLVSVGSGAGQSIQLTTIEVPVSTLVTEKRIYRTIGGTFIFVASIAPSATTYTDTATDLDLAGNESLQSQEYYPPPDDIAGLIALACGSLAAFRGNSVLFSEPYQPGGWPPAYEKIFDYPVVALGTFGQTLVVATTGYTYLVQGNDPRSFSVARVPDPYPCVSKRSMVSVDGGVVYSSSDGLIFVGAPSYQSGGHGVYVLTRELMTADEWARYDPPFIQGAVFDGRYYGFYKYTIYTPGNIGAGFVLDFSTRLNTIVTGVVEDPSEYDKKELLCDLDFYATAVFANPQVKLHLVIDTPVGSTHHNVLYKWEGGIEYSPLTWRSKQFSFPYAVTFSVGKMMFNTTYPVEDFTFRLLDGVSGDLLYSRSVSTATPFRLPSIPARTEWMLEVEGIGAVQLIQVATAFSDLTERKGAQ